MGEEPTIEELEALVKVSNLHQLNHPLLTPLNQKIDVDGDGTIDYTEFLRKSAFPPKNHNRPLT